jgi:hypothetical protein
VISAKHRRGTHPCLTSSYYTQIFNDLVFTTLKNRLGEHGAAVFARSATAGGQRFPVHWGGDCESTYEAMAESLRGGLSLTSSGFAFWSHDIGGFEVRALDFAARKRGDDVKPSFRFTGPSSRCRVQAMGSIRFVLVARESGPFKSIQDLADPLWQLAVPTSRIQVVPCSLAVRR